MEEEKLKAIISKTNKDYSRFYDFIKYKYKEDQFSNKNLIIFSILLSGLFTYKHLNKKIIYHENNGHFNSPQNLLNRKLYRNYMMEGVFRFLIGSVAIFIGASLFKIHYLKIEEPLFIYNREAEDRKKNMRDSEDIVLIKSNLDQSHEEKIIKVGADLSIEDLDQKKALNIFNIDKTLHSRNNINKFFEQYYKNNK